MKPKFSPTTDLFKALGRVSGEVLRLDGQLWKLTARRMGRDQRWYCDAQCLDPKDREEAIYCIVDLWQAESDRAEKMLNAFAKLGGFVAELPERTLCQS